MAIDPARMTVVCHASELGAWELVRCRPDERLAPYLYEYQGYRESAAAAVRRVEMAIPAAVVIINFGPAWRLADGHAPGRFQTFGSFVAGLYSTYALSENTGASFCLQMNLTPVGARLILGMPMHHLSERIVDLSDVLGAEAAQLESQLAEAADWASRFVLLERALLQRLAAARRICAPLLQAWRRLNETGGTASVASLAAELDWSRKHLSVRFREEIGLPPKTLGRLLRFRRAVEGLSCGRARWTEIALDCGYYDQAHLIRDFHQFAGMAPKEFLRRRLADGTGIVEDVS